MPSPVICDNRPPDRPLGLRERAVRRVVEAVELGDHPSHFEAIRTIATKVGLGSPASLAPGRFSRRALHHPVRATSHAAHEHETHA